MNKKLLYSIVFLVVLAGVIVPLVCSNNSPQEEKGLVSAENGKSSQEEETILELSSSEVSNSQVEADEQEKQGSERAASNSPDKKAASPQGKSASSEVNPVEAAPEAALQVGVAVVGMDGELLYSPAQVKVKKDNACGLTVLGALDATGLPYTMKPFWPGFVESIKGQSNKGTSGWMYLVNGEVPMHMADKHPIKEGDQVIWWYSKSMDQPSPQWDDLVK